jgi:hypothetical protein
VAFTTHPHLAPRLKKVYSYTFTSPLGLRGPFWGEATYSSNENRIQSWIKLSEKLYDLLNKIYVVVTSF